MPTKKAKKNKCEVALLVDEETGERLKSGRFVPDRGSMEEHILKCLRAHYSNVAVVPFNPDVTRTIMALRALEPGIVFNATEWVDGDRSLDAAITGLLEILKLKYTGSGPTGMRLARDKALSKTIAANFGVEVPRHFVLKPGERVKSDGFAFPMIVKPQFGDGSDEIRRNSVVKNQRQLRERVRIMHRRNKVPLVCEEFIPGRDLYVALLGNRPQVMPAVELVIGKKGASAPQFATFQLKNDGAYRTRWRIRWRKARLDSKTERKINDASRRIFHALNLRDYGRVDFRLTPDNRLVFIEANPNPDLHPHAMGNNLCFAGVQHADLICAIVEAARRRPGY
jgi:D-alanine-D-alanine ligase